MFPTKHVSYVLLLALYLVGADGTSFFDGNVFDGSGELIEPYTRYEDCSLLTMANEQLTDAHAVKLAKALHKMKGLESLYLHYNKIGDAGETVESPEGTLLFHCNTSSLVRSTLCNFNTMLRSDLRGYFL